MLLLVCSFLIATAEPACSDPMPAAEAIEAAAAANRETPFRRGGERTPAAVYPADQHPAGAAGVAGGAGQTVLDSVVDPNTRCLWQRGQWVGGHRGQPCNTSPPVLRRIGLQIGDTVYALVPVEGHSMRYRDVSWPADIDDAKAPAGAIACVVFHGRECDLWFVPVFDRATNRMP